MISSLHQAAVSQLCDYLSFEESALIHVGIRNKDACGS